MVANARALERQLRSMANERRLAILKELKRNRTMTVSEIAEALDLSIALISQHLRILRAAQIVEHKKRGKHNTYRLSLKQSAIARTVLSAL